MQLNHQYLLALSIFQLYYIEKVAVIPIFLFSLHWKLLWIPFLSFIFQEILDRLASLPNYRTVNIVILAG